MSDWQSKSYGEIATFKKGINYTSSDYGDSNNGLPFITIKCVKKGGGYSARGLKFYKGTFNKIDLLNEGDVIFSITDLTRAADIVGSPLKVPKFESEKLALASMDMMRISPVEGICDKAFLYHRMMLEDVRLQMAKYAAGSTVLHLETKKVPEIRFNLPPLAQQQKIANILSTVDNLIEKTQILIDKYTAIKQGMMADLFTRGIDLTAGSNYGKLRPSVEDAPELYKQTELGWVPKEWEVKRLEDLLSDTPSAMRSGPFGSSLLKHELVEKGIPLLGIDNIFVEQYKGIYRRFVTQEKFNELSKYAVRPNDVVITIMGTVGRCCVIPDDIEKALSSKHLWTMTFDKQKVISDLVCWQLNYADWARSWFHQKSQGGIMEAIQSSTLKNLLLPVPSLDEQLKIAEIYRNLCAKIGKEQAYLGKLSLKKKGLMQDLLTGKVRVN